MAAVVSSRHTGVREKERHQLLSNLLSAVKQCQIRFGGRTELATESDQLVYELCECLELALNHGLRNRPLQKNSSTLEQVTGMVANTLKYPRESPCFWHYVREHLNKHELERYSSLKEVWTDFGRGRAWLRSSLNERSLNRYIQNLLMKPNNALTYYHEWSLLLDEELNAVLPDIASGLSSIFFAISINDKRLNESSENAEICHISKSEPILAMPLEDTHIGHRRRRTAAQVISFENDGEDENLPDGCGAPPTCLSSSVQSASILCSTHSTEDKSFNVCDSTKTTDQISNSSYDSSFLDFDCTTGKIESAVEEKPANVRTLIPLNDSNVGELILITGEEVTPAFTVDCLDSDDERTASLLNVKFEEPVKAEDIETVLNSLEEVKDINSRLKTKLMSLAHQKKEENSKLQMHLQALTRENEVLKHQLRKYVEAVQMLNKDGTAAHEALACLEGNKETTADKEEAVQYEQKLVLVAEMHGELMEFNDKLQRVIYIKENMIKRLERELTDLRGPLPSLSIWEDGVAAVPETLINICIPSVFLTGGSSDIHHVYQASYVRELETQNGTFIGGIVNFIVFIRTLKKNIKYYEL
ncbi:hypothetical protein RUM43_005258 [Polyplax serrata]|uniref:RUN domain-containing protein n=1 Tax=Polyplax serrata TaxID=468196 RepID=A0AAN8NVR7_POLSC